MGMAPDRGRHKRRLNPLDVPPRGQEEFQRKCHHVARLIRALNAPDCTDATAGAWTLAFADEADPTFCVRDWIDAGWRDPVLVLATLRVCGTRAKAEMCMHLLGKNVSDCFDDTVIIGLSWAMRVLEDGLKPANDL